MPKLKLLPSLREKKRYLAYEALTEQPLSKDFSNHVLRHTQRVLGLFESAQAGIQSVDYDAKEQRGVLRVGHTYVDKTRTALMLLQSYENQNVLCRTLTVSGILQKARLFGLGSGTSSLSKAKTKIKGGN
ncbi:MAG: Rpp14/Pop5 family protein [Nanoarchaeota archaeon]